MSSFIVDERFFSQPGFETMYDAWSEVFSLKDNNTHSLSADVAIGLTIDARREAISIWGGDVETVKQLEALACRYARVMPTYLEERISV